jgi:hypothetical protein
MKPDEKIKEEKCKHSWAIECVAKHPNISIEAYEKSSEKSEKEECKHDEIACSLCGITTRELIQKTRKEREEAIKHLIEEIEEWLKEADWKLVNPYIVDKFLEKLKGEKEIV